MLPNGVKVAVWDLIKCLKKNGFNMKFAFILNGFGQKMNKWLNRVFKFGLNTLGFAENGQFTNT